QGTAEVPKQADRVIGRKRAKHPPDQRALAAPEVCFGNDAVRDIASRATADENLRARLPGAFEEAHRTGRVRAPGEDGRRQARRTRADDCDVSAADLAGHAAPKEAVKRLSIARRPFSRTLRVPVPVKCGCEMTGACDRS